VKVVDGSAQPFERAIGAIRSVAPRAEFVLEETPAPQRLAPHALAITAEMCDQDDDTASGKFVLLHDPDGIDEWDGTFRAVVFIRASVEPELVDDPLMAEVVWSWLTEALHGLDARHIGGTVTKSTGDSFGTMTGKRPQSSIELRASWTPIGAPEPELAAHFRVWLDTLAVAAGLAPLPAGVVSVAQRQRG
jgi:hypothetical protein